MKCRALVLVAILSASCSPTRGCAESAFELASESRLPRWFQVPPGYQRADLTVTMTHYIPLVGEGTTTFVLRNSRGQVLERADASLESDAEPTPYPRYRIFTVGDKREVIEHRRLEPVFYINDDPQVRSRLGLPE
jgi:hypothetical protein